MEASVVQPQSVYNQAVFRLGAEACKRLNGTIAVSNRNTHAVLDGTTHRITDQQERAIRKYSHDNEHVCFVTTVAITHMFTVRSFHDNDQWCTWPSVLDCRAK